MCVVLPDDFLQKDRREEALCGKTCPDPAVHVTGLDGSEHRVLVGLREQTERRAELAVLVGKLDSKASIVPAGDSILPALSKVVVRFQGTGDRWKLIPAN